MKPKHGAIALLALIVILSGSIRGDEVSECKRLAKKYKAQLEVRVEDAPGEFVRVDMLNDEYAIEADWLNHKVYESVGQATLYSIYTGKKPAVLLLIPVGQLKAETEKWTRRAKLITDRLKIKMFVERALGA